MFAKLRIWLSGVVIGFPMAPPEHKDARVPDQRDRTMSPPALTAPRLGIRARAPKRAGDCRNWPARRHHPGAANNRPSRGGGSPPSGPAMARAPMRAPKQARSVRSIQSLPGAFVPRCAAVPLPAGRTDDSRPHTQAGGSTPAPSPRSLPQVILVRPTSKRARPSYRRKSSALFSILVEFLHQLFERQPWDRLRFRRPARPSNGRPDPAFADPAFNHRLRFVSRRYKFRDRPAAVGNDDGFARSCGADVFTELIFQRF